MRRIVLAVLVAAITVVCHSQVRTTKARDAQSQQPAPVLTAATPQPKDSQTFNSSAAEKSGKDAWDKAAVLSNYLLIVVGIGGILVACITLGKLERQTKATEDTLIQTQRPKINVRTFFFSEPQSNMGQIPNGILEGSMLTGQFYIVNLGGTRAIIKEILCEFYTTRESMLPAKRPWEGKDGVKSEIVLAAGQSKPYTFGRFEPVSHEEAFPLFSKKMHLYLMGWIDYVDDLNIRRTTRFCRLYDPATYRFIAVDDAEYESAD